MWASLASWLVAGAVADGDGVDAYMGGDGAADGAGAGVYVVLACECLVDKLLLLGGTGREHAHAGARMLGQKREAVCHGVGDDALGAAALLDGLDLARLPLRRNGQANIEHLRELAGELGRAAVLNEVLERAGNQQQVRVGQGRADLCLGLVQAAAVLAHGERVLHQQALGTRAGARIDAAHVELVGLGDQACVGIAGGPFAAQRDKDRAVVAVSTHAVKECLELAGTRLRGVRQLLGAGHAGDVLLGGDLYLVEQVLALDNHMQWNDVNAELLGAGGGDVRRGVGYDGKRHNCTFRWGATAPPSESKVRQV